MSSLLRVPTQGHLTHNWIRTNDHQFKKTGTLPLSYMREHMTGFEPVKLFAAVLMTAPFDLSGTRVKPTFVG